MKKIKILIIEDSSVIRSVIKQNLQNQDFVEEIRTAPNGEIGYEKAMQFEPDIILLDVEMPVLDGLGCLKKIREKTNEPKIIMVSAITTRGGEITIEALNNGANDYMPKPSSNSQNDSEEFFATLIRKIRALVDFAPETSAPKTPSATTEKHADVKSGEIRKNLPPVSELKNFAAIAIASSTGGPEVLGKIFKSLNGIKLNKPIFITQHMPQNFTKILAERLSTDSGLKVKEGEAGEKIMPGSVYVAPGDYHMVIKKGEGLDKIITTNQNPPVAYCRPSADPMFESIVSVYGQRVLGIVLTGMGHDGLDGSRVITEKGGFVVAQTKETCAVWGMPRMVTENGLASEVMSVEEISDLLRKVAS